MSNSESEESEYEYQAVLSKLVKRLANTTAGLRSEGSKNGSASMANRGRLTFFESTLKEADSADSGKLSDLCAHDKQKIASLVSQLAIERSRVNLLRRSHRSAVVGAKGEANKENVVVTQAAKVTDSIPIIGNAEIVAQKPVLKPPRRFLQESASCPPPDSDASALKLKYRKALLLLEEFGRTSASLLEKVRDSRDVKTEDHESRSRSSYPASNSHGASSERILTDHHHRVLASQDRIIGEESPSRVSKARRRQMVSRYLKSVRGSGPSRQELVSKSLADKQYVRPNHGSTSSLVMYDSVESERAPETRDSRVMQDDNFGVGSIDFDLAASLNLPSFQRPKSIDHDHQDQDQNRGLSETRSVSDEPQRTQPVQFVRSPIEEVDFVLRSLRNSPRLLC